jgi:hypothetical protein
MDLVELGARSMDLVHQEFLELGCLVGKKMEWSCFCGSGAAWSSPQHALSILSLALKLLLQVLLTGWLTISDGITDGLL